VRGWSFAKSTIIQPFSRKGEGNNEWILRWFFGSTGLTEGNGQIMFLAKIYSFSEG
jgi:hypothetical protein